MNVYKINLIVWGSFIVIGAIFAIPFFLLELDQFLSIMPYLMTGIFAIVILLVAIVMYRVFIRSGRKKAATIETGVDAEATILSVEDTGVTLQNGLYFQVKFNLEVRPDNDSTYMASVRDYVSRVSIAQYQPGTIVRVKYNPRKREEIAIIGVAGQPQTEAGLPDEEPVFASDEPEGGAVAPARAAGWSSSRGKLMVMIGLPLLISVIALVIPLLALSNRDAISAFFIEKTVGKYQMTGATFVDDYAQPEETVFKPDTGNKWVMVTLTVTNTGSKMMDIPQTQLKMVTQEGSEYTPEIVVDTGNDFDAQDLAAGATYTGNVVYEIPVTAVPAEIKNIWDDRVTLVPATA